MRILSQVIVVALVDLQSKIWKHIGAFAKEALREVGSLQLALSETFSSDFV